MSIDVRSTFRVFLKCVIRSKFKKIRVIKLLLHSTSLQVGVVPGRDLVVVLRRRRHHVQMVEGQLRRVHLADVHVHGVRRGGLPRGWWANRAASVLLLGTTVLATAATAANLQALHRVYRQRVVACGWEGKKW